jgi:hypothetical protein
MIRKRTKNNPRKFCNIDVMAKGFDVQLPLQAEHQILWPDDRLDQIVVSV